MDVPLRSPGAATRAAIISASVQRPEETPMFAGEFRVYAEIGGLFRLPPVVLAAFPPSLGASRQVILLKSPDASLWLYQATTWETRLEATRHQLDDQQSRLLMHYVVAESVVAELDGHGRLAIPNALRTYAEISTEVVVIGMYERLELWSPTRWDTYLSRLEDRYEQVLDKILDLL
jgi:MraZ protein